MLLLRLSPILDENFHVTSVRGVAVENLEQYESPLQLRLDPLTSAVGSSREFYSSSNISFRKAAE